MIDVVLNKLGSSPLLWIKVKLTDESKASGTKLLQEKWLWSLKNPIRRKNTSSTTKALKERVILYHLKGFSPEERDLLRPP